MIKKEPVKTRQKQRINRLQNTKKKIENKQMVADINDQNRKTYCCYLTTQTHTRSKGENEGT